jgi:hypothetical protein
MLPYKRSYSFQKKETKERRNCVISIFAWANKQQHIYSYLATLSFEYVTSPLSVQW